MIPYYPSKGVKNMKYISTRDKTVSLTASQAIAQGLARDGGLLTPEFLPEIGPDFLESLRENDIAELDYSEMADSILILHGTKDEIVPEGSVRAFAEKNGIEYIPVERADHRFMDPKLMDLAIEYIQMFLDL